MLNSNERRMINFKPDRQIKKCVKFSCLKRGTRHLPLDYRETRFKVGPHQTMTEHFCTLNPHGGS